MWPPANKNKLMSELVKVQLKRKLLLKNLKSLETNEKKLMNWLLWIEATSFRQGDRVYIENDTNHPQSSDGSHRTATVRYTSRTKRKQILVCLTTDNGYKTRRVPKNIRKLV